jgi:hypothetical protein
VAHEVRVRQPALGARLERKELRPAGLDRLDLPLLGGVVERDAARGMARAAPDSRQSSSVS